MKTDWKTNEKRLPGILRMWMTQQGWFYIAGSLLILALKHHYSVTDAAGLRWILSPVAGLVSLLSEMDFTWMEQTGYVNHAHGVVIAPACAGVNFLIICFASLFFSFLSRWRDGWAKSCWFALSAAIACLTTLIANSLRIILSVFLYEAPIYAGWLTPGRAHQLAGMVLFISLLVVTWLAADRMISPIESTNHQPVTSAPQSKAALPVTKTFLLIPFAWYGLITIVVPWVNGAGPRFGWTFIEHSIMVMMVCGGAFLVTNRVAVRAKKKVDRSD